MNGNKNYEKGKNQFPRKWHSKWSGVVAGVELAKLNADMAINVWHLFHGIQSSLSDNLKIYQI